MWARGILLVALVAAASAVASEEEPYAVVALGSTRATALGNLLDSIAVARAWSPDTDVNVMVVLDATHAPSNVHLSVREAAESRGAEVVIFNFEEKNRTRSAHLAAVYKAMLDLVFVERRFAYAFILVISLASDQRHRHAVFLEDDLIVSPDFIEFFSLARRPLRSDATLFCASAWNDRGHLSTSLDEARVMRGEVRIFRAFFVLILLF